jgi:CO/xanthine dehydrogenase FAD-binding subunit
MIPVAFDYVRPESVDAAVALLGERGEDASVLAGGHSLLPLMKLRFAAPELLIDIGRLEDRQHLGQLLGRVGAGLAVAATGPRMPRRSCRGSELPDLRG